MPLSSPSAEHLSQVILHATAPAFLLGAVAGFISLMSSRTASIVDRLRALAAIPDEGDVQSGLRSDIPRLQSRVRFKNIFLAVWSGIAVTVLLIVAFASAFLGIPHVWGAGALFLVALALLGAALVAFAREIRMAFDEHEHYR